jgi:hypothetical protein
MENKKKFKRIFTLNENRALRINSALAYEIGLRESIMLLQLEFLISISDNERDGKKWTYQSAQDLRTNYFPFWSVSTIQRALKGLEQEELIIKGNYNRRKSDRTLWYSLNYEKLSELKSIKIDDYEQGIIQNEHSDNPFE